MIQLTEAAAKRLLELKNEEKAAPETGLRIWVKRGGCSGFSYKMEFAPAPAAQDKCFEVAGHKLYVDQQSLLYLMGMKLDFEGGLNGQGFVFSNPNATKTCGCGSSFAV